MAGLPEHSGRGAAHGHAVGDPINEAVPPLDYRDETTVSGRVDPDDLDGLHISKLVLGLRDAHEDWRVLAKLEEPEAGVWELRRRP